MYNYPTLQRLCKLLGLFVSSVGIVLVLISPLFSTEYFPYVLVIEPITYAGVLCALLGFALISAAYVLPRFIGKKTSTGVDRGTMEQWSLVTQRYFEMFHHDLGRPLSRILGKERELRASLKYNNVEESEGTIDLLDEIERQVPNFRLMMSNIQALIQLELPKTSSEIQPVEPEAIIRKIIDRYTPIAKETGKEITWWSDPQSFGVVSSNSAAIEHIVTNLVDNTMKFADKFIEICLTKNEYAFQVKVRDDGPGIEPDYQRRIFDRGWTPEIGRGQEKTSSGLGLFIANTLAKGYGGAINVASDNSKMNSYTEFILELPIIKVK
jgi:signal transduction histidine kinase